jgi:hypothetical protein
MTSPLTKGYIFTAVLVIINKLRGVLRKPRKADKSAPRDVLVILLKTINAALAMSRYQREKRPSGEPLPAQANEDERRARGRRREQLKEHAHKQCKPISPRQWELVQWVIVLINVPPGLLAAGEAMALLRARWQIELLWKLWKDLGKVDEWQTAHPARILCELYAKLLGMLVQHWLLLLSCWDDPHHSLVGPLSSCVIRCRRWSTA